MLKLAREAFLLYPSSNRVLLSFPPLSLYSPYIIPQLRIIFPRYLQTEEMERRAEQLMKKGRARPAIFGSFLVPAPVDAKWGIDKELNEYSLTSMIVGNKIRPQEVDGERYSLCKLFSLTRKEDVCYPKSIRLYNLMPVGLPILDCIAIDSRNVDSYKYPSAKELKLFQNNRGVDYRSLFLDGTTEKIPVRELTVGSSTNEEIEDAWAFYEESRKVEKEIFPADFTPFKLISVPIPVEDYNILARNAGEDADFHRTGPPSDDMVEFPVKLLLGNALRYMIVISWPVMQSTSNPKVFKIKPHRPQNRLIEFLGAIQSPTGHNISQEFAVLKDNLVTFRRDQPNHQVSLQPWLDVRSLAKVTGWGLQDVSMAALMYGVTGSFTNTALLKGNSGWCVPWSRLPEEYQLSAIGQLKAHHILSVTLMTVLLRDILPDPDAFAAFTSRAPETPQYRCVSIFNEWVLDSFQMTELGENIAARYRTDLLDHIVSASNKSDTSPPRRVARWSELFSNWNPITMGGPRRLHPVRERTIAVIDIVRKSGFRTHGLEKEVDSFTLSYVRFGRTDSYITDDPPVVDGQLGLLAHPDVESSLMKVDPESLIASDLIRQGRSSLKSGRYSLYEYLRLNPNQIAACLKRFDKAGDIRKEFWLQHDSLYEDARIMHFRLMDKQADPVEWIEVRIQGRLTDLASAQDLAVKDAEDALFHAQLKKAAVVKARLFGTYGRRVGVLNRVPTLAEIKPKRPRPPPRPKTTTLPFTQMTPILAEKLSRIKGSRLRPKLARSNSLGSSSSKAVGSEGASSVEQESDLIDEGSADDEEQEVSSELDSSVDEVADSQQVTLNPVPVLDQGHKRKSDEMEAELLPPVKKTTSSGMTIKIPARKRSSVGNAAAMQTATASGVNKMPTRELRTRLVMRSEDQEDEQLNDDPAQHSWPVLED